MSRLLLHRLRAAATTLNWATLRLLVDDPRKAVEYGRIIHARYREMLELPAAPQPLRIIQLCLFVSEPGLIMRIR